MQNGIHFYKYYRIREYYYWGRREYTEYGNRKCYAQRESLLPRLQHKTICDIKSCERHIQSCISIIFHYQIPRCSGSKVFFAHPAPMHDNACKGSQPEAELNEYFGRNKWTQYMGLPCWKSHPAMRVPITKKPVRTPRLRYNCKFPKGPINLRKLTDKC